MKRSLIGGGASRFGSGNARTRSNVKANDSEDVERYVLLPPPYVYPLTPDKNSAFPDFDPYKPSPLDDEVMLKHLHKGYSSTPVLSSESKSACLWVLPLFKQRANLRALSYFLGRTMEKYDFNCRIQIDSSFKPPPRVTLTDQKREAWLKDLANKQVPLRKLSRTIPHGLRNRSLLEQCCAKKIPLSRAIWFARCVGANELRGLKRRGGFSSSSLLITHQSSPQQNQSPQEEQSQSPESLWLQEWTEQVTEYLEYIALNDSDKKSWRENFKYMSHLCAHLMYEHIIDRAFFLSWTIRFLRSVDFEKVPIALVLVKMFWSKFESSKSLSQGLALALLEQLSKNNELFDRKYGIVQCIEQLFETNSESFVIPLYWHRFGSFLCRVVGATPKFNTIQDRNESLTADSKCRREKNPKFKIVGLLSSLVAPYADLFDQSLPAQLKAMATSDDEVDNILHVVFDWSLSGSMEKVYLVGELSEILSSAMNVPVSRSLQTFLMGLNSSYKLSRVNDLVFELFERNIFEPFLYFRWIISSGLLFTTASSNASKVQLAILHNLPNMPGCMLLSSNNELLADEKRESDEYQRANEFCDKIIQDFCGQSLMVEVPTFNLLKKHKVSLANKIVNSFEARLRLNTDQGKSQQVSSTEFSIIRNLLTSLCEDYRALLYIIKIMLPHITSFDCLYIVGSAIALDYSIFSIIDRSIASQLVHQFGLISDKVRMTEGVWKLVQFCIKYEPGLKSEIEMAVRPIQSPEASLSPVSDLGSTPNIINEVFGSDKSFNQMLSLSLDNLCSQKGKFVKVLYQLADVDRPLFLELSGKWVREAFEDETKKDLLNTLVTAISTECLSLERIIDLFLQAKIVNNKLNLHSDIALKLLCDYPALDPVSALIYEMQIKNVEVNHLPSYLKLIVYGFLDSFEHLASRALVSILDRVSVDQIYHHVVTPIVLVKESAPLNSLQRVLNNALGILPENEDNSETLPERILKIVRLSENSDLAAIVLKVFLIGVEDLQLGARALLDAVKLTQESDSQVSKESFGNALLYLDDHFKGVLLSETEKVFFFHNDSTAISDYLYEIVDAVAECSKEEGISVMTSDPNQVLERMESITLADSESKTKFDILFLVKMIVIHKNIDSNLRNRILERFATFSSSSTCENLPGIQGLLRDSMSILRADSGEGHDDLSDDQGFYLADLMLYDRGSHVYSDLKVRSFDLLEDSNPVMSSNDVPISLKTFETIIEKKDP